MPLRLHEKSGRRPPATAHAQLFRPATKFAECPEPFLWTQTDFAVTAVNKGTAPGILRISLPGGKVGHVQTQVDGVPIFHEGEEAFLFLWEVPGHGTYVLGWAQGTFRIARDARCGEERITQDSAAMPVFDPETHQFRKRGTRNLPLAAFQTKLRRALEGLNP